jgi:hypothetical protein
MSLSLPFGLIVCPPCRVWQVGGEKPSLDDVLIVIPDFSFVKKNFLFFDIFIKSYSVPKDDNICHPILI